MAFTFIDIEEEKTRLVGWVFLVICLFYFLTAYLILLIVRNSCFGFLSGCGLSGSPFFPSLNQTISAFILAFLAALLHWYFSTSRLMERMCEALGARDLDPKDTYHQYFRHIVDEVSIATGRPGIEAMVVASAALNAFALQDFSGRSVIGVTEGLLSALNRSHIEAVVAHEAGHIASKDSLLSTVISSLGELYGEALGRVQFALRRIRGRAGVPLLLIYLVLVVMNFLSMLLRAFLSRQREYRADAIAVRLTRNPVSLAEGLRLITEGWRGSGAKGEHLESVYLINPRYSSFDEAEGVASELFSTHPPVKKRVEALLQMAHMDQKTLDESLANFKRVSPVAVAEFRAAPAAALQRWFVFDQQSWQGPFTSDEVRVFKDIRPDTWVRQEGAQGVVPLYQEEALRQLFVKEEGTGHQQCPRCKVGLDEVNYEGAPLRKCSYCQGVLVDHTKVSRILIRNDMRTSPEVERLAKTILASPAALRLTDNDAKSAWAIDCPRCNSKMHREFFVHSYPVEIDNCISCGSVWFDKYELELLQYLYEHKEEVFYGSL